MSVFTSAITDLDANSRSISSNEAMRLSSEWTFVENLTGDQGAHTLFTVTGDVIVNLIAVCSTNIAGAGTMEAGVAGNTAEILPQIADATDLDAGDVWTIDSSPGAGAQALRATRAVGGGVDIILTIGTADLTAGVVTFYCLWRPLSSDGNVTVTTPA